MAILRTGVVAAGAARGVVSPVFGQSQVAVEQVEESTAPQQSQKPRKVRDLFSKRCTYPTQCGHAPSHSLHAGRVEACAALVGPYSVSGLPAVPIWGEEPVFLVGF